MSYHIIDDGPYPVTQEWFEMMSHRLRKTDNAVSAAPINPVRDAIEQNLRGRLCSCCRGEDSADCPCLWWWDPWGQTFCSSCRKCFQHCDC